MISEWKKHEKLMTFFICIFLGGSGFLGQHIVRLIEERDPTVKEIRIVDLRPYENRLSKYQEGKTHTEERNKTREKLISTRIHLYSRFFVCFFP
jgi:nucleoside-diphosphate-sugar epimerase